MNAQPPVPPISDCSSLLVEQFKVNPNQFDLIDEGGNSQSFKVSTDEGRHFILKRVAHQDGQQLEEAFILLHHLRTARKFNDIVSPLRGENGRFLQSFPPHQLTLTPFVNGTPLTNEYPIPEEYETAVASTLAHLHDSLYTTSFLPADPKHVPQKVDFQDELQTILSYLTLNSENQSPLQLEIVNQLQENKASIKQEIEIIEQLVKQKPSHFSSSVLVHGNLNGRYLLKSPQKGLRIINWSNLQAASPEKDLFWFVHQSDQFFSAYSRRRMPGFQVTPHRLEQYFRIHRMDHIINQCQRLFHPSTTNNKQILAHQSLQKLLPLEKNEPDFQRFGN
ncbi:MAG: phosphotransferase [Chloroflexota bacterium]